MTSFKLELILDALTDCLRQLHTNCYLYLLSPGWQDWTDLKLKYAVREGKQPYLSPEEKAFSHFKETLFWKQPQ
jgi:hypothetical protein